MFRPRNALCANVLGEGCNRPFVKSHPRQKYCPQCQKNRYWYLELPAEPVVEEEPVEAPQIEAELEPDPIVEAAPAPVVLMHAEETPEPPAAKPLIALPSPQPRVVVLVDFENICVSLEKVNLRLDNVELFESLSKAAKQLGRVVMFRVYADWAKHGIESRQLSAMGLELIHVPVKTSGTDRSDMTIGLDILEYGVNHGDILILASGDADMEDPARRAVRAGKTLVVMGVETTTSAAMKAMADAYLAIDSLFEKPEDPKSILVEERIPAASSAPEPKDENPVYQLAAEIYRIEAVVKAHEQWRLDHATRGGKVFLKAFRDRSISASMWQDYRDPTEEDRSNLIHDMQKLGIFAVDKEDHWNSGMPISVLKLDYDHPLVKKALLVQRYGAIS